MSELLLLTLNLAWAAVAVLFLAAAGRTYLQREELPAPQGEAELPRLSIIVPARDEAANIGNCLDCITRLDYPEDALEIVVVDDNSSDGTDAIVEEYASKDGRVKLISAGALPEGWMGKSHACWQGAQHSSGDWLLFIDADTYLKPSAARAALDYALTESREFLSVIPFQRMLSVEERLVLPGIFLRFASAIDFRRVNDPEDSFCIANGQFLLFSRDAYSRIGGHRAIRSEVSDDLAFARAVKRERVRGYTLFGEQQVETRMYRSAREVWRGFSKNAAEIMHAGSMARTVWDAAVSFALAAGVLLPAIMLGSSRADEAALWGVATTVSVMTLGTLTVFFVLALRALRVPVVYVAALPVGLLMHGAITINAFLKHKTGSREWKGRQY